MESSDNFERVYTGAPWEKHVGYCRAVKAGPWIAVTGTVAVDSKGSVVGRSDGYLQTKTALEIIERALRQLGADRRHIFRTRMFVTSIARWEEFGRAHKEFFATNPPATSMVEVSRLIDPDCLIEIEADAYLP